MPGAEPFDHSGGAVGFLLCHGFTGTPQSLRPWADHLAAAGYTVSLPRWPGHGTTWQELNRTTFEDWYAAADRALSALTARCEQVVVGGLSMGGALALRLAEERPADVAGLVLVNPAVHLEDRRLVVLPLLKHLVGSLPGIASDIRKPGVTELAYDRTPLKALHSQLRAWPQIVKDLPSVTAPTVLLTSPEDHVVPPSSSRLVLARISSKDVEHVLLHDSYHVATLDEDAPVVFERSVALARRLASAASADVSTAQAAPTRGTGG